MTDSVPDIDDTETVAPTGFSAQELQHLLSSGTGGSSDRSAELLGLNPLPSLDETVLVGGAALLVRGQLSVLDDTDVVPKDAALDVGYALSNATRWIVIKGASAGTSQLAIYIESDKAVVFARRGELGTWWFTILNPSILAEQVVVTSVMSMAHVADDSAVIVRAIGTASDQTFSIQRRGKDWGYAHGKSDAAKPETLVEDADPDAMLTDLIAFVTGFTESE